ncbi:MAG: NUDIX domain-containing protein [Cyclobacteriaceae bacterium]|nr:NUDIX domain-containing protein [Cyclobacteriaceae bacterium]
MEQTKSIYSPYLSVDCVVFGFDGELIRVLLIKRKQAGQEVFALPGDLLDLSESLDETAVRVLNDLTGLNNIYLEQFGTFGDVDRISNPIDIEWLSTIRERPEERVITTAYFSLIKIEDFELKPNSFAEQVLWQPIEQKKQLAFDHNKIANTAWSILQYKIRNEPIVAFNLLPKKFTLRQLQGLYESIVGSELDKRNFRKRIQGKKFVSPLEEFEEGVAHKPARYYSFDEEIYKREFEKGQWFLF